VLKTLIILWGNPYSWATVWCASWNFLRVFYTILYENEFQILKFPLLMDSIWTLYGFHMDFIWTLYGLHMDSIWGGDSVLPEWIFEKEEVSGHCSSFLPNIWLVDLFEFFVPLVIQLLFVLKWTIQSKVESLFTLCKNFARLLFWFLSLLFKSFCLLFANMSPMHVLIFTSIFKYILGCSSKTFSARIWLDEEGMGVGPENTQ
jgi:hypothetical protein